MQLNQMIFESEPNGSDQMTFESMTLPLAATVADLAAVLPGTGGCAGFLVAKRNDDEKPAELQAAAEQTGLAERLTADGGTLLELDKTLASYGLNATTCAEVTLFAVFAEADKQPSVRKKDIVNVGFGDKVYVYVKLVMELSVGTFTPRPTSVMVPVDATGAQLSAMLSCSGLAKGCAGFLATARKIDGDRYDYYDDYDAEPAESSGLAQKLASNGGTLLELGQALSSYGLDDATSTEVTLYPVFTDADKQPTVFKKDIEEMGFGENIYEYVRLQKEDKEIVSARGYFSAPVLSWLQKGQLGTEGENVDAQSILFSMEDNFQEAPKPILTVQLAQEGREVTASCTNLAGNHVCSVTVAADDIAGHLQAQLCEKLQWTSMTLWDGSEKVADSKKISGYSLLTAERRITLEHICGCYQHFESGVHPAGYSASGSSSANMLVLEPGKAGLQYHFKGDYKRAEELRRLVMNDARWTVESQGEGKHVVRIVGKATLNRYFVHERCGPDGVPLSGYRCYALVTIPLEQLERGMDADERQSSSTPGSGWTCGAESYKCRFFLPMCVLNAIRSKPDGETDAFVLRKFFNAAHSAEYPYNGMSDHYNRRGREVQVSAETFEMIKYFRERLKGKSEVAMAEILELQAATPKPPGDTKVAAGEDDGDDDY